MRWLSIITSVVCIGLLCVAPARLVHDPPIVRVTAVPITEGRLRGPIVHSGAVRATAATTVGPTGPTRLRAIEVSAHTFVRAGDALALLDTRDRQQSLAAATAAEAQAEADLRQREEAVRELEQQCESEEGLAIDGLIATTAVDATRASLVTAERELTDSQNRAASAKSNAAEAAAAVERGVLRAPFDGFVTAIASGGSFFQLASDVSPVEVVAGITPREAPALRPGDAATLDLGTRTLRGHVERLEQGDDGSVSVVIDVGEQVKDLPPGTPITIALDESERPVVARVPNAALLFSPTLEVLDAAGEMNIPHVTLQPPTSGASRVWVYDGSAFVAVEVRIGERDDEYSELVDGPLRPGDKVVTTAVLPAD